jgi:hypothetical protein
MNNRSPESRQYSRLRGPIEATLTVLLHINSCAVDFSKKVAAQGGSGGENRV